MTFMSETKEERRMAVVLALLAAAMRLLPHPANVSPVASTALFAGAVLPASLSLWIPLAVMAATDLVAGPHGLFLFTWGSMIAAAGIGMLIRRRSGWLSAAAGTLAGSTLFFLVTNFGVFLYGGLYPRTADGLRECFAMALPFFRNSLLGDFFYAAALFGAYSLVRSRVRRPARQAV